MAGGVPRSTLSSAVGEGGGGCPIKTGGVQSGARGIDGHVHRGGKGAVGAGGVLCHAHGFQCRVLVLV